jgi:hypothetical protein
MAEMIFEVRESPEGGYEARALGAAILTEADSADELRANVMDAVKCHFDHGTEPKAIRLIFIRRNFIAT